MPCGHSCGVAAFGNGNVVRECGAAEGAQIDVGDAVLRDADGRGDALGGFKLPGVALAVGKRKRVERVALGFGDGEHRR